jgi:uncharacterized protein
MIHRRGYIDLLVRALKRNPVVALLGPRQCGKTSLARELVPEGSGNYFDLEDPVVATLMEQPKTALEHLTGLVVIDEAQRAPGLFPVLRVLADRRHAPATFLILGSASPDLSRQASESLAGRVEIIDLHGFSLDEVGIDSARSLWVKGGFPRSFLARSHEDSYAWRQQFIRTFLERDLAQLGFGMSPSAMGRFWRMLAHYHGQLWNGAEVAASLGIAPNTARAYLDALEQTYMIRRLEPWHANVGKRLVKTPKIYLRDSGLFHALMNIGHYDALHHHPKLGASWEGFALEQVLRRLRVSDAWFYAAHGGVEIDLFLIHEGKRIGVEFKRQDAPRRTRSMHTALRDLELDALWVIYPGEREYDLGEKMLVRPLSAVV